MKSGNSAKSQVRSRALAAVMILLLGLSLSSSVLRAQPTTLPPAPSHPRPTMMSMKAESLQKQVAVDIADAKAKGQDVTDLRIAVEHYETAEKALKSK
jgi:hypothetical protein